MRELNITREFGWFQAGQLMLSGVRIVDALKEMSALGMIEISSGAGCNKSIFFRVTTQFNETLKGGLDSVQR